MSVVSLSWQYIIECFTIPHSTPGGGSPYKISVAHARRKSADIGLHFPARRGPASAAFRVYFSSAAEKKGIILIKFSMMHI